MHEYSICEGLVEGVLAEFERLQPRPARLLKAKIAVGKLRQVIPETMAFAYEVITRGTLAEGSELEVEEIPVTCRCQDCDWTGAIEATFFVCGQCSSVRVEVVTGMELELKALEVSDDDD